MPSQWCGQLSSNGPVILLAVILSNSLILAELVLELGVDVTSSCHVVRTKGHIIEDKDLVNIPTDVELASFAYRLQHVHFPKNDFTYVTTGFPKDFDENLCLSCLPQPNENNTIATGCEIEPPKQHNDAFVGLQTTVKAFGTVAAGFKIVDKRGRLKTYRGDGDMTLNLRNEYSVMLFRSLSDSVIYWEYNHQKHIKAMFRRIKRAQPKEVWERARGPVFSHRIVCKENNIVQAQFKRTLLAYRSVQLERVTNSSHYNKTSQMFERMTKGDIYRAIIALKSVEDVKKEGKMEDVFVYPQCATYNMVFAIPTLIMMASILVLLCVTLYLKERDCDNEKLQQLSEYLHVLNDSESIIPGCTTTQSANTTPLCSQELLLEETPSHSSFYLNSPSVHRRRWLRDADRIEVRWDIAGNISGLHVVPQGGSGNTLKRVTPKHLINLDGRYFPSHRQ